MNLSIADLRRNYALRELRESDVDSDPFRQFQRWFDEAIAAELPEPNAMTLATATETGMPSARVVLLKGFDQRGFVFYTNYNSRKGKELSQNPRAGLVFWWAELERQVRIEGTVERVSSDESDAYFHSRPIGSQLGAWVSDQSQTIPSRQVLEERLQALQTKYQDGDVSRPPHWGGFRVVPQAIEFWQGRPSRLHDRLLYSRVEGDRWQLERLSP
ncbi:pyridoxamine 5'-phosphate oxidase [Oculatella sp. LEGE 06141]|uniref:pyridoxamine 5'-phosphate oxidase n=1 Tax=Oculatella sp. LEGE 06141 TaxID=1828648 RepID=UPI001881EC17|nr:pyridoxamine 5'-phosphate oxidase [Oculatella sp. LEGE 06141]MBE9179152.1 pyridoxamine 5'-phosphate oxidase [Oculatella sp. LEGE 06141]